MQSDNNVLIVGNLDRELNKDAYICPGFGDAGDRIFGTKESGKMRKINTIIFDMDGTVLNTLDDLTDAVNHVLGKFDMPPRSREEYRLFFGSGIRYAISCAVLEGTPDSVIDDMIPVFKEYYDRHCLDKTRPYDGIIELMSELKKQGYRLAIVSNKIDSAVLELNERFFSDNVAVAVGEKKGIKRKPAPDTVLEAMNMLGSSKEETIYVGDSEVDLQTAKNTGIPCISVLWGFRDKDFLIENGATLFASKPEDVLSILNSFDA